MHFKIKCTQKNLKLHSKMANLNYKVQNCKCTKMKYLKHYVCSGIELTKSSMQNLLYVMLMSILQEHQLPMLLNEINAIKDPSNRLIINLDSKANSQLTFAFICKVIQTIAVPFLLIVFMTQMRQEKII